MKKLFLLSFFILCSVYSINAQSNAELFNSAKLVWFGVDMSRSKLVGVEGFTDP